MARTLAADDEHKTGLALLGTLADSGLETAGGYACHQLLPNGQLPMPSPPPADDAAARATSAANPGSGSQDTRPAGQ